MKTGKGTNKSNFFPKKMKKRNYIKENYVGESKIWLHRYGVVLY